MPVVPGSMLPSVTPSPTSGLPYQTSTATAETFGAGIGAAQERLGARIEGFGDMLEKHALSLQADTNAATAKDLFLQGDVELGQLTTDFNTLEGANRVNAYPKFLEDVNGVREKLKARAPNDAVARMFDQDFARRVGYTIVDGARQAATANRQYQTAQSGAIRENTLQHIAVNAKDDQRFEEELKIGKEAYANNTEYKGAAPEVKAQHDQAYVSSAWSTRLQAMARSEPLRARELFDKNKDAMDGLTQIKVQDSINNGIINVQSRIDSDQIIKDGALVSPDLREKLKKLEGYSAKSYSDYKQTSSGYGTKAQAGDEALTPAQLKVVHEQRLDTELARAANIVDTYAPGLPSGTRDALISLTYNTGSKWTQEGLGRMVRGGDLEGTKAAFGQYVNAGGKPLPALVSRRAEEASWFGGEPTSAENRLDTMTGKAAERAAVLFPDDPGHQAIYTDTLQQRIQSDYKMLQSTARTAQLQMRNTVQTELLTPDHAVTSYEQLSPKAQQAFDLMQPEQQAQMRKVMTQNATADVPLTPTRQSRADELYGMSKNEPDKFMALDITQEDLTRTQKSQFNKMQADRKALVTSGAKVQSALSIMQPLLNDAQIFKSTTNTQANQEYNKFSGVFERALNNFEQEKKRPANEKEIKDIGAGLLRDVVLKPGTFWDTHGRAYEQDLQSMPKVRFGVSVEEQAKDYEAIPPGSWYIHPSGRPVRKPQTGANIGVRG